MGEKRGARRVLVGKPEGKRPFGRTRRRWEDNIEMYVKKQDTRRRTGFIWLRVRTSGGLL
jgi:hypothetical protein